MHVTVAGKQVETGEALKTHVRDGLTAIARKYFDQAVEAHVTFHRDGKNRVGSPFGCDINFKAGRDLFMRAEGHGQDAHRAFEQAAEHVAKRLRRYRRRVNEHARSLAHSRTSTEPATHYVIEATTDEPETETLVETVAEGQGDAPAHGAIIAEQPTDIARLSVSEAVMRLDLGHLPVLLFRNSGSGTLAVVYRRDDGHFGWIVMPMQAA